MKREIFVLKDDKIFKTSLIKNDDRLIPGFDKTLYIEEYTYHNRFIKDSFREEIDDTGERVVYLDQILTNITWYVSEEKAKQIRQKIRNSNFGK